MIVGFNHNVTYRGAGFHVQTEDSGPKHPQLVTLLYHEGTIIASQKTVYADIIKVDRLEQVIEDLAKEQHKGMLRRLTSGEFDEKIGALGIILTGSGTAEPKAQQQPAETVAPVVEKALQGDSASVKIVEEQVVDKFRKPEKKKDMSLNELIYAYLTAGKESS